MTIMHCYFSDRARVCSVHFLHVVQNAFSRVTSAHVVRFFRDSKCLLTWSCLTPSYRGTPIERVPVAVAVAAAAAVAENSLGDQRPSAEKGRPLEAIYLSIRGFLGLLLNSCRCSGVYCYL